VATINFRAVAGVHAITFFKKSKYLSVVPHNFIYENVMIKREIFNKSLSVEGIF